MIAANPRSATRRVSAANTCSRVAARCSASEAPRILGTGSGYPQAISAVALFKRHAEGPYDPKVTYTGVSSFSNKKMTVTETVRF